MDSLCAFLRPETVSHLEEHARNSKQARVYLLLLHLSAWFLCQAQGIENNLPEAVGQAVIATSQSISSLFPDGFEGISVALEDFTADRAIDCLQRCTRVAQAGKTALWLRLSEKRGCEING